MPSPASVPSSPSASASASILLPLDGVATRYQLPDTAELLAGLPSRSGPARSRTAFAAAHVVADPRQPNGPGLPAAVDWDATLAFRHHLWSLGLGIADAMDTAQRGMGLDWPATRELIRRSGAEARAVGGRLACGVGTDQLGAQLGTPSTGDAHSLKTITAAYEEQWQVVEEAGAQVVLMASRALARAASGPDDYAEVYGRLLAQSAEPVILHWLGTPFDPALAGYWGSDDLDAAAEHVLALIRDHADKVDGIKVSLLDADREIALRRALPDGVRLYTGDDFHYPELIRGDEHGFSHALLGVFDPLARHAAAALEALDRGDTDRYRAVLEPTVPLARHVFAAPTRHYKTGVVFLAHLAGHQDHFTMVGGAQEDREVAHLARLFVLAAEAGALPDPELAAARMRAILATKGFEQ
ncbi:dihydrodipicolinate synthase family protein [Streptacidiphilus fuscans]|uniref:dihydrodipicolinate synthase family protein n=1 Tax=Streptacidiphilus fuscans TaxID=2789292 RepID=UPI0038B44CA0